MKVERGGFDACVAVDPPTGASTTTIPKRLRSASVGAPNLQSQVCERWMKAISRRLTVWLSGHSEAGFPGGVVVALTRKESRALAERVRTRLQVLSGCPRRDPGHVCPRSRNLYPQHGTGAAFGKAPLLDGFNNEVARVVTFSNSEESG